MSTQETVFTTSGTWKKGIATIVVANKREPIGFRTSRSEAPAMRMVFEVAFDEDGTVTKKEA